jgi:hypothetical protein
VRHLVSLGIVAVGLATTLVPDPARSMCCPFPPDGFDIHSSGQLNWIVMHRDRGEIQMIPNVLIRGDAVPFSLVVPIPTLPRMEPVPSEIWTEAAALTAPSTRERIGSDGLGCSEVESTPVFEPQEDGGVVVHEERTVGAFLATVLSSDDAGALVDWLDANGFEITAAEEDEIEPLTDAGWFFVAMKLDTTQVDPPDGGWNTTVDPISLTFPADELEVPLAFLSINRGPSLPLRFYVVDDHRVTLPGFGTFYANRISRGEMRAIADLHPNLSGYLGAGRFLTRLDRTFFGGDPMEETLTLARAPNDEEFRTIWGGGSFFLGFVRGWPGSVLLLAGVAGLLGSRGLGRHRSPSGRSPESVG